MTVHVCEQCGARYESPEDSCQSRFDALIALDHSRREPWGSRHGSAFAAFTLQHPAGRSREMLQRSWELLYRIWIAGEDPQFVAQDLRRLNSGGPDYGCDPPLPQSAGRREFRVTIADLGAFEAESYPRSLEDWCRATLEAFGLPEVSA